MTDFPKMNAIGADVRVLLLLSYVLLSYVLLRSYDVQVKVGLVTFDSVVKPCDYTYYTVVWSGH